MRPLRADVRTHLSVPSDSDGNRLRTQTTHQLGLAYTPAVDSDPAPRLRLARDDELSERFRMRTDPLTRVFGHNSVLLENWYRWYGPLIRDLTLPARLKEIVRLRVAQLNACEF